MLFFSCLSFFLSFSLLLLSPFSRVEARYNFHFNKAAAKVASDNTQLLAVLLPLDHFSDNPATFSNRYWVNDEFYLPGGPVILLDGGEGDASSASLALTYGNGADQLPDYAQRFGALLILWEHRFYGESIPQGVDNLSTPEEYAAFLQYLTFEQALEDVAVFARNFSLASHPHQDLRPNSVPWIFVGGSYPGVRAAFMRLRNPEIIYASLASSAPVQLQVDFWEYYVAAERKLLDTTGDQGCLNDLHAFANYINTIVTQRNITATETLLYNAGIAFNISTDNSDSAWENRRMNLETLAETPPGDFQDYGLDGGLAVFCSDLTSSYFTNDTTATAANLQNGIVAYYGIDRAIQIYAQAVMGDSESIFTNATQTARVKKAGMGRRPSDGGLASDEYSWIYQTCTEAGYFQDSNSSNANNIIPGFVDVPTWIQERCVSNFGNSTAKGPNVSTLNAKYHGWHMTPSNVLFVNGEDDPWRALSVASDIDPTTPGNTITTTIPAAGKSLPAGTVFGFLIKNGLHVSDLGYDLNAARTNTSLPGSVDESANQAHELFATALSSWLPAYTKYAAGSVISTALYTASFTGSNTPTVAVTTTATMASTQSAKSAAERDSVLFSALALTVLALGMAFLA